ncbi:hypothetical protein BFP97_07720 [Roseivirga sp. 4D4]|uniref:hypothetical protein n=1 Tax=Roseivirga sp. 4D4 TaxID=1889784 RepID=UPI000853AE9E|nr:hypothetical protein [Roseivirga sp. 4D4]OEK01413.1 hypothetical protein BFP97_07720 [Roseivirga sp. 4D4]
MIILKYPEGSKELSNWKSRLARMTVPHLLVEESNRQPSIKEGNKAEIVGAAAIDLFLNQYERDLKSWNQDRCDMWFFDEKD